MNIFSDFPNITLPSGFSQLKEAAPAAFIVGFTALCTLGLCYGIRQRYFSDRVVVHIDPNPVRAIDRKLFIQLSPVQTSLTGTAAVVAKKHAEQLADFEKWAEENNWAEFHSAHYDWWAFPINRDSMAQGSTYTVQAAEITQLKANPNFMQNYHRTVELVTRAWGWDLEKACDIPANEKTDGQQWTYYEVRLGKMADSLYLFGEFERFRQLTAFYNTHVKENAEEKWVKDIFARPIPEIQET